MKPAELAAFLKSRRDRIRPADIGLVTTTRRRVPGLRREEVAQLASLSADYYIELERGSGAQPSTQVVAALARALRLNGDERDHLFRLAARPVPPSVHGSTAQAQSALLCLLERLATTPAQIVTDLYEPITQNDLAIALLGQHSAGHGFTSSLLYRWFTDPEGRLLYPEEDHQHHSRGYVADLQAVAARRGRDAQVARMIGELRQRSQEFAALWDTRDVALRRADHQRLVHPTLGIIAVEYHSLFSEDGGHRLQWFTAPPGTQSATHLELLSAVSTSCSRSEPPTTQKALACEGALALVHYPASFAPCEMCAPAATCGHGG
ncbi:helix-turn-helix domain-containing protein [Streptomyces sp. NA02950]|uniref:helix-turn-helix transcriptional regulator n=1 Tax=Streptomyces sp. NA02950 TaxID=2742137 RepID=UPI001592012D|nr:helix-turn-helix transcriptional regulator [Streptomyces sp. NA02950]QKV97981.1 helix-turn-helix domain-containing protein [Streptomyces sp. NA02950]